MSRIYIPSREPEDWRRLLADPKKHWRPGYSAYELAVRWEAAVGLPDEVKRALAVSGTPALGTLELLLAIPEYRVALPGRGRASQNDLFVLARTAGAELLVVMVEGKVAESFGSTIGDWLRRESAGKTKRLEFLRKQLRLPDPIPLDIPYQLLHRAVSAISEARRFNAAHAILLVHSFSPVHMRFNDYARFVALFGQTVTRDCLIPLRSLDDLELSTSWVCGIEKS